MKYGAMNFPIKPIIGEIGAIADMGMNFVELALDPPQCHYSRVKEQRREIKDLLRDRGLNLVCHMPTFVHTADLADGIRRASVAEVVHSLEVAVDLGADKVVLHPGVIKGLALHVLDQAMDLAMESLAQITQRARQLEMPVCIENMFTGVGPFIEPDDFRPVFEAFPEAGLVLDIAHAHIGDAHGDRIERFIARWGDRLDHLHVSDNNGRRDEHLPLGEGSVPLARTVAALNRIGYEGTITLEIFGPNGRRIIEGRERLQGLFDRYPTPDIHKSGK
jgi:sugar phosphate isomerase/epimerase